MSKLPAISGSDCVKVLNKIGFVVYRQRGSHITMVRKSPPSQTTIPKHQELDRGTLRAIISASWINCRSVRRTPVATQGAHMLKLSFSRNFCVAILTVLFSAAAHAQTQLPADLTQKIDTVVADALTRSGVPSASIAIVKDGQIVYVKAYGDAKLEPKKPLDFEPGTKWQYSNTNFVIAGAIVEKVARMPLLQFLQQKVFAPLGMTSVLNIDQEKLTESDPTGYLRFALGPLRPSPKEGKGWLFAAGELAMRAEDLAKWDLSIIDQKVLKPTSYRELGTEIVLKNGVGTQYGLGVSVGSQGSHRFLSHGGEVSGFTAQNMVFPDDRVAIVALTNQDAASAAGAITSGIAPLLFATSDAATATKLEQAKRIFADLQQGKIDRSLFTDNANAYFSEQALQDFARGLGPLGSPQSLVQASQGLRGGMTLRVYIARFPQRLIRAWTNEIPYRKLEQYQIAPQN